MRRMVILIMLAVALALVAGCVGVSPTEMVDFKTKRNIVFEMSAKCATEPDTQTCCVGLAEAAKAMDKIIQAMED